GLPAPPYYQGRFSNGPNWLDDIAAEEGVAPLRPSLAGGTDYAFGGARSGANTVVPLSGSAATVPTLDAQVALFATAHPSGIPAGALTTVWGGANDIIATVSAYAANPMTNVGAAIAQAATNEASAVRALYGLGATDLLVVGNPDLGVTPALTSQGAAAAMLASTLTQLYSTDLQADIAGDGVPVRFLDLYSLIDNAVADPAAFGLSNASSPCYVPATPGAYGGPGTVCGATMAAQDQYLFWDQLHPTAAGYALVADAVLPEPPSLLLLAVGAGGVVFTARRRAAARLHA
ncbi:MAG: SGNH/GDSL hydrolase family protein, partial [Acetobacteraceae bacterium]|nr:SGNH/GDSL hydrolase family protein [Acetobacteraceae bacterium]